MKRQVVQFVAVMVIALAALALFNVAVGRAAPAGRPVSRPAADRVVGAIRASRFTSIPFGIETPLSLTMDGRHIDVSGHGSCPEPGSFRLRVFVTQDGTHARALGWNRGECPKPEDWTWHVDAYALGPRTFVEGPAEVCAMVVVHSDRGPAQVGQWCKDVILE